VGVLQQQKIFVHFLVQSMKNIMHVRIIQLIIKLILPCTHFSQNLHDYRETSAWGDLEVLTIHQYVPLIFLHGKNISANNEWWLNPLNERNLHEEYFPTTYSILQLTSKENICRQYVVTDTIHCTNKAILS